MYLLLIYSNYVYSREIKTLLDTSKFRCEIVNCSSSDALLEIAAKIGPDLVLVDFDLFTDDLVNIVGELRRHSPETYIMSLVGPDHYSLLHQAIVNRIDDFVVKPLQREDMLLRIKMGLYHKSRSITVNPDQEDAAWQLQEVPDLLKESVAVDETADHILFEPSPTTEGHGFAAPEETSENNILNEKLKSVDYREIEAVFEKEPAIPDDRMTSGDDHDLFGMISKESSDGMRSFEAMFDSFDELPKKCKKNKAESKDKKAKQGKREYVPISGRLAEGVSSFPVEVTEDNNDVQPEGTRNPLLEKTKQKKVTKVTHKLPADKPQLGSRKILQVAGNVVTAFFLLLMVGLSFFLIQSRISGGSPVIVGYQMYVVLSGSMSPAFDTGSLIFVKSTDPSVIMEGDIITFSSSSDASRLITHRVVGLSWDGGLNFITRGDANIVNDPSPVPAENVVGLVIGSVPYIGYLLGYAQTRWGLIMLFFIPGLSVIIMELRRLYIYMAEAKAERLRGNDLTVDPASGGTLLSAATSKKDSAATGRVRDNSFENLGFK